MSNNKEQLDTQMRIAFASTDPPLTRFPHCIFYNNDQPVRLISQLVDKPVGVWGDRCLVDANNEPYLEPENGRIIKDFEFWALPKNQEYALAFTSKACGFAMVIPADTCLEVLQKTYEFAEEDEADHEFDYETYIEKIATLIPELGWAYIPLDYGHDYAIFVTSEENAHYVEEFKQHLKGRGNMKVFDVSTTETGQQWNGPILWL